MGIANYEQCKQVSKYEIEGLLAFVAHSGQFLFFFLVSQVDFSPEPLNCPLQLLSLVFLLAFLFCANICFNSNMNMISAVMHKPTCNNC